MTHKQRRLVLIGGGLGVLAVALMLNALRDSIVLFNSPSDVVDKHVAPGARIRLGGLVAKEVADALKKSGHWQDDYAQRAAMPVGGAGK
jgi:cytochrome c-type biogenesis protein CcmE